MSWNEAFLKDLADIQLGKMLDEKKNQGEYRPYLGNDNVQWGFVDTSQIKEMKFKSSELERFSLRHGDILVCEGGDPGRCALWLSDTPMCYQKALHRVRVYDRLDSRYLFHYLTYLGFTQEIRQYYTGGATIKHLPKAALSRVVIRYPEISIQKRIASILSAYDELIENNRKEIKLLEEAAQRLYKEWFIDFKFPSHETTPIDPETNLPEGWKRGTIGDRFSINTGKRDANYGTSDGHYPFFTCAQEPIKAPGYSFETEAIILAGNGDLYSRLFRGKFEAYQRTYVIEPFDSEYLFLGAHCIDASMRVLKNRAAGSTIKYLTKGMIESIDFVIPTLKIQEQFTCFCESVQSKVEKLQKQVAHLQEARDRLLPKLMSGEIEVN